MHVWTLDSPGKLKQQTIWGRGPPLKDVILLLCSDLKLYFFSSQLCQPVSLKFFINECYTSIERFLENNFKYIYGM